MYRYTPVHREIPISLCVDIHLRIEIYLYMYRYTPVHEIPMCRYTPVHREIPISLCVDIHLCIEIYLYLYVQIYTCT